MKSDFYEGSKHIVRISSSPLYIEPSLSKGIARTYDLFGSLNDYNYSPTDEEADSKAISRDWSMVGLDMLGSIILYEEIHTGKSHSEQESKRK